PTGEIGELIVRGPQVSTRYLATEPPAAAGGGTHNAASKIADDDTTWHRMGDVGYFDEAGRFWYCGRKSQRVETTVGPLYTECVEAQINTHTYVEKSAIVGAGPAGSQTAFVVIDADGPACEKTHNDQVHCDHLIAEVTKHARAVLGRHPFAGVWGHPSGLPTDIRHNSKIRREELAVWAEKQLRKRSG
ncbi:MAG: hypothetical protein AAF805_11170, partial [Planctomycetota bacterium]